MKRGSSFLGGALVSLLLLAGLSLFRPNAPVAPTASAATPQVSAGSTPTSGNLIANPSFEQNANNQPTSWMAGNWGSNKAAFTYNTALGHSGTHSVSMTMTKYKNGDAKWYPVAVAAASSTKYTYSDWYQSNVATELDAVEVNTKGVVNYVWLGSVPAASNWSQASFTFTTIANLKTITFYHLLSANGSLTIDDSDFELGTVPVTTPGLPTPPPTPTPMPTAPTISVTSPATSAIVTGTQTIAANASDAQGLKSVQFEIDGKAFGSAVTTAPFQISWDTTKAVNGSHTVSAVATNIDGLSTAAANVTVTVSNPTPPSVSISAPAANTSVSGMQAVAAAVADAQGVKSVTLSIDGALGASMTTAPYTFDWDTTKLANGSHTITVTAINVANLSASASETITVNNQTTTPTPPTGPILGANIIPNPSVEASANGTAPDSWEQDGWGTNTAAYSYLNTGHTGNHSLQVQITSFTSGDADWAYAPTVVTGGGTYLFTDWYKSNVTTEVDAAVTLSDGTTEYDYVQTVLPSTNWAEIKTEYDAPKNATSITFFHLINSVGTLTTDDYSLTPYTPTPLHRGLVSLTFDDGWTSQYSAVLPLLKANNQLATFYIISGELNDTPAYMTVAQIQALQAAGNEIGSHSVTHPDMTKLTSTQLQAEMQQSQTTLQNTFGVPITDFAYPYGAYNGTTVAEGQKYYQTQRGIEAGFNTKDTLSLTDIKVQDVYNTTTPAQVAAWVDQANAQKTWLVLVYHEVAATPADPSDAQYTTQPSDMQTELNYIKASGIGVDTVAQAVQEIAAQ